MQLLADNPPCPQGPAHYQVDEAGTDNTGKAKTELDVGCYHLVDNMGKDNPGTAVTAYVAQDGDTVQTIAGAMYGNPSLWYLIADANGHCDEYLHSG